MNTLKSLCVVTTIASSLLFGMAAPSVAPEKKIGFFSGATDPFEISTARCNSSEFALSCMTLVPNQDIFYNVSLMAEDMRISVKRLRELNGWSSEVSGYTVIPEGVKVAFGGRI